MIMHMTEVALRESALGPPDFAGYVLPLGRLVVQEITAKAKRTTGRNKVYAT